MNVLKSTVFNSLKKIQSVTISAILMVTDFPKNTTYIASCKFAVSTISIMVVVYGAVVDLRWDIWVFVLNRLWLK